MVAAKSTAQVGYTALNQDFRFSITGFSAATAGSTMKVKIPGFLNGNVNIQVMLQVTALIYPTSFLAGEELILNQHTYISNRSFAYGNNYGCYSYTL